MKKVLTILGARPQFIKASVVSRALADCDHLEEILLHTGQHSDMNMSQIFFQELKIPKPKYNLRVSGGLHGEMTGQMLSKVEQVCLKEKPNLVIVYGDTNSTLAGALAAAKLHIQVAHVEAGLRSGNLKMPEEVNRILTDRISQYLFTPTENASNQLKKEGIQNDKIYEFGDVMYDVILHYNRYSSKTKKMFKKNKLKSKTYILMTVHRAENTDDQNRLSIILEAANKISEFMPVIWPIHPRTRLALGKIKKPIFQNTRIKIIEPVGFFDMMYLEKHASVIATDSGGVQKEAFFHGVPCVTLREETEWTELVESGWNRLAPPSDWRPVVEAVLSSTSAKGSAVSPYGHGDTAKRIAQILDRQLT